MTSDVTTPSMVNLPDKVLADITFHVGRSSVKDIASLEKVSQAFRRHWSTEGVQRVCHLGSFKFVPAIGDLPEIRSLAVAMTQLFQAGNLDALFMEGITSNFKNRRRERADEGLAQLEDAADRGHIKARYLYDIILIGLDLERGDKCYNILATLMQQRLLESMRRMGRLRDDFTCNYLQKLQGDASNAANILGDFHANMSHCNGDDSLENQYYMDQVYGLGSEQSSLTPLMTRCVRNVNGNVYFIGLLLVRLFQ